MRPDSRSISLTYQSNGVGDSSQLPAQMQENSGMSRRCLQSNFEEIENPAPLQRSRGPLTMVKNWSSNISLSSLTASSQQTGKRATSALRSGTDKITKTLSNVRLSLDEFSQKLRRSTRRRHRMTGICESPNSPKTPGAQTRHMLGRTPTKMYSPFGIETPRQKRLTNQPGSITKRGMHKANVGPVYSPNNKFSSDVADARKGMAELNAITRNVIRRSMRN